MRNVSRSSSAWIGAVWLAVGAVCVPSAASSDDAWAALAGLPIVDVRITSHEIFDAHAAEKNFVYSWANALHVRTHASVIERELLFAEGDAFDPLRVAESARNLRRIGIFQDVVIEVARQGAGVAVHVVTDDRWSTQVIADISSQGDIVQLRVGLEDINFVGRALQLGGTVVASNDVDALDVFARDPRLFGTRWRGAFRYAADDLALLNEVRLERPYYSELVRGTADFDYRSVRGERRLFDPGSVTRDTLDVDETFGEAWIALHGHARTRSRLGLLFSRRDISRDVREQRAAVGLVWGWMRRSFRPLRNVDRYDSIEDVGSGWTLQLGAGADIEAFGGERTRPFWRADAAWSTFPTPSTHVGVAARHHGFGHDGRVENGRVAAETWGFWRQADPAVLAWSAGVVALVREPEYQQFTLGGDARLRGYPARHDVGTRALFASVEERMFSNWNILFLRLGATLFVDAAQAWFPGESPRWRDLNVGAGFGLRIGNRKSGAGVTRLDFAFGRNSFEVSVSGGSFFRAARGMEYLSASLVR